MLSAEAKKWTHEGFNKLLNECMFSFFFSCSLGGHFSELFIIIFSYTLIKLPLLSVAGVMTWDCRLHVSDSLM